MHTPQQVLVVDDDVMSAPDGAAALELLATSQPAVILLDMLMPKVDGWEFARLYEQRPGPHAPIIVLTAARDAQVRPPEMKANAWLSKPFHLDALFACVEQYAVHP